MMLMISKTGLRFLPNPSKMVRLWASITDLKLIFELDMEYVVPVKVPFN
jgi:hypothetical protein